MIEIRSVFRQDIKELKLLLSTLELFPPDMLDPMIYDYLNNENSEDIWFTAEENKTLLSIGYCAPEKLTMGTFNLYALGVNKDAQGKGVGKMMMNYIEDQLKLKGHRVLIVETSGTQEFASSREFYEKLSYVKEATIRDFWEEGDDKVVYWKKLNPSNN